MTTKTVTICTLSLSLGMAVGASAIGASWLGKEMAVRETLPYQTASMIERCVQSGQDVVMMITIKAGTQVSCTIPQDLPKTASRGK